MRKTVSYTLEEHVIEAVAKRAAKHHLSKSRLVEQTLRKVFRLK